MQFWFRRFRFRSDNIVVNNAQRSRRSKVENIDKIIETVEFERQLSIAPIALDAMLRAQKNRLKSI